MNTTEIPREMRRKLVREKKRSNPMLINEPLQLPICNFKLPPLPDPAYQSAGSNRLKDKVTSLVQMQIKSKQSNQNFLNQEKATVSALLSSLHADDNKKDKLTIHINTKYEIVSEVALSKNYKLVRENDDWNILWIDGAINSARAFSLKRHQKINHFPGMNEISRKDKLQKNLKIMQRYFPLDYEIFPKTWNLPNERMEVINYLRERKECECETFIIKPACSSQGRGIILISDVKSLSVIGNTICQLYISNPFLIDGFKFDLRIYVLVTSCDPFRIYVYEEGLARFATCHYEKPNSKNLNNVYMHLTNYSVQRNSDRYNTNEYSGTKRRSSTIYEWFKNNGYDADSIWKSIDDVLIKTMLCANNSIQHHYTATFPDQYRTSACFELLGFDIILDDSLRPFVLEVNHSPSLETETPLDQEVKSALLNDVFNLVNSVPINLKKISDLERLRSAERLYWSRNKYMSSRKAAFEFRKVLSEIQVELERTEMENKNGFRLLFPILGQTEKYQRFFDFNCEHHRNYFNRCVLLDESEHRRFIEIQRDTLPKVMKRNVNSADIRYNRPYRQPNGDTINNRPASRPFKLSRDGSIINNTSFSPGTGRRNEYSVNSNRYASNNLPNSNLLNYSKASLQRLLSSKNPTYDRFNALQQSSQMSDLKSNSSIQKLTLKNEETEACTPKQQILVRKNSKRSKRNQNDNPLNRIHKVFESHLNEQSSINLEWESSLSSNKIQQMSNLIISDADCTLTPRNETKINFKQTKIKTKSFDMMKINSDNSDSSNDEGPIPSVYSKILPHDDTKSFSNESESSSDNELENINIKNVDADDEEDGNDNDNDYDNENIKSITVGYLGSPNINQLPILQSPQSNDTNISKLNTTFEINYEYFDNLNDLKEIHDDHIELNCITNDDKIVCYSKINNSEQFTITESKPFQFNFIGELEEEAEIMKCGRLEIIDSFYEISPIAFHSEKHCTSQSKVTHQAQVTNRIIQDAKSIKQTYHYVSNPQHGDNSNEMLSTSDLLENQSNIPNQSQTNIQNSSLSTYIITDYNTVISKNQSNALSNNSDNSLSKDISFGSNYHKNVFLNKFRLNTKSKDKFKIPSRNNLFKHKRRDTILKNTLNKNKLKIKESYMNYDDYDDYDDIDDNTDNDNIQNLFDIKSLNYTTSDTNDLLTEELDFVENQLNQVVIDELSISNCSNKSKIPNTSLSLYDTEFSSNNPYPSNSILDHNQFFHLKSTQRKHKNKSYDLKSLKSQNIMHYVTNYYTNQEKTNECLSDKTTDYYMKHKNSLETISPVI